MRKRKNLIERGRVWKETNIFIDVEHIKANFDRVLSNQNQVIQKGQSEQRKTSQEANEN